MFRNKKFTMKENATILLYAITLLFIYWYGYHFYELWQEIIYFIILAVIFWYIANGFKFKTDNKKLFEVIGITIFVFILTPTYSLGNVNLLYNGDPYWHNWSRKNITFQESMLDYDQINSDYKKQVEVTSSNKPMFIDFEFNNRLNNERIVDNVPVSYLKQDGKVYCKFTINDLNYFVWYIQDDYDVNKIKEYIIKLNQIL